MRRSDFLVIEILPAHKRLSLGADGQPDLRLAAQFKVVGRLGATHPRGNHPGIDRVRQDEGPTPTRLQIAQVRLTDLVQFGR